MKRFAEAVWDAAWSGWSGKGRFNPRTPGALSQSAGSRPGRMARGWRLGNARCRSMDPHENKYARPGLGQGEVLSNYNQVVCTFKRTAGRPPAVHYVRGERRCAGPHRLMRALFGGDHARQLLCGEITFELTGNPTRIYQRHCSVCRKQGGPLPIHRSLRNEANFGGYPDWRKSLPTSSQRAFDRTSALDVVRLSRTH